MASQISRELQPIILEETQKQWSQKTVLEQAALVKNDVCHALYVPLLAFNFCLIY